MNFAVTKEPQYSQYYVYVYMQCFYFWIIWLGMNWNKTPMYRGPWFTASFPFTKSVVNRGFTVYRSLVECSVCSINHGTIKLWRLSRVQYFKYYVLRVNYLRNNYSIWPNLCFGGRRHSQRTRPRPVMVRYNLLIWQIPQHCDRCLTS